MKITPVNNKVSLIVSDPNSDTIDYFADLFPGELTSAQAVEALIDFYGDTWGPDRTEDSIVAVRVITVEVDSLPRTR